LAWAARSEGCNPFSEDDFVAKMQDIQEYLKIFKYFLKNKKHCVNAHYFISLGCMVLIAVKIGIKFIEEHSEGQSCRLIDSVLPIMGKDMYAGLKMTLSCKLWSSEDAWERDKNNAVYKKYTV
jgi:hypothetical protein